MSDDIFNVFIYHSDTENFWFDTNLVIFRHLIISPPLSHPTLTLGVLGLSDLIGSVSTHLSEPKNYDFNPKCGYSIFKLFYPLALLPLWTDCTLPHQVSFVHRAMLFGFKLADSSKKIQTHRFLVFNLFPRSWNRKWLDRLKYLKLHFLYELEDKRRQSLFVLLTPWDRLLSATPDETSIELDSNYK